MALGFVLTGYYLNLIIFTSLILVHEMGHYVVAMINGFKVEKIIIYPYGGMTKISDMINRDICEELLVATSGIIAQYLFYMVIVFLYREGIVREYVYNLYGLYNNQMIFFNMMPIYPLDGSKIFSLIMDKYFPYYRANIITMIVSLLCIVVIILASVYSNSYSNVMVMGLLFTYLYKFYKNRKYIYNRFLLERYLYKIEYPNIKIISSIGNMFKNKSHIIKFKNTYMEEKELLSNLFNKKKFK